MKKNWFLLTILFPLTLCSCSNNDIPRYEHTFSDELSFNDLEHWNGATCGHNLGINRESHDLIMTTENGYITYKCSKCDYSETVPEDAYNGYSDLSMESKEDKIQIASLLEQYVIDHHMRSPSIAGQLSYLNYNTCDEKMWEHFFGENGTICKTNKEDYWSIKPIMQSGDFITGINYCINHVKCLETYGTTTTPIPENDIVYFHENLLFQNEINYGESQAHKDIASKYLEGTDGHGYSIELAKQSFKKACDSLIEQGIYNRGDNIKLVIGALNPENNPKNILIMRIIKNDILEAFNNCDGGLTLSFEEKLFSPWFPEMMAGQYDIGYGSASGSVHRNFLEAMCLKSNTDYGFTMSWGADTNIVDEKLLYKGHRYSFDTLVDASNANIYVYHGKEAKFGFDDYLFEYTVEENNDLIIEFCRSNKHYSNEYYSLSYGVSLFAYENIKGSWRNWRNTEIKQISSIASDKGLYTYKISNDEMKKFLGETLSENTHVRFRINIEAHGYGLVDKDSYSYKKEIDIAQKYINHE